MTVEDLYWLAGLLEGEGCFSFIGPSEAQPTRRAWRIEVASTDKDVIDKAAALMNVPTRGPYGKNRKKVIWRASIDRRNDVVKLCQELFPLMGARRAARISEMLTHHELEPARRKPGRQV